MAEIRVGKVSSINYEAGTARVVYTDKDASVTKEIPFLSFEYHMPLVGSQVLVAHLSNGNEMGIILGRTWSSKNIPFEGKKGLYRKELAHSNDEAVVRYDEEEKTFTLRIPKGVMNCYEEGIEVKAKKGISIESEGKFNITGKGIELTDTSKDETITFEKLSKQLSKFDGNEEGKAEIKEKDIVFSAEAGQITVEDLIKMKNILGV